MRPHRKHLPLFGAGFSTNPPTHRSTGSQVVTGFFVQMNLCGPSSSCHRDLIKHGLAFL